MNQVKNDLTENRRRILKKVLLVSAVTMIVVIIGILVATPHFIMSDMINGHIDFNKTYKAEEFGLSAKKISLTTSDKINLTAYEVYVDNPQAIIIFLSGIHKPSVTAFFGHAKMLKNEGYASILLELRAHGESEGDLISLGYKEYLDTEAAVEYIEDIPKYDDLPIIVYGLSMGGSTAINSIAKIPEIDGLISLSAFSSWEDVFYDNMLNMGAPKVYALIQMPFVKLYTTYKYGMASYNNAPKHNIGKLRERPALLIHSTNDSQIPYKSFKRLIDKAPTHVDKWSRDGDLHMIVKEDCFLRPQEDEDYRKKILEFLEENF